MIDVHAHVLPGVDDGAKDMEESVQMLLKLALWALQVLLPRPIIIEEENSMVWKN